MLLDKGIDFIRYFFETPRAYRALMYTAYTAQRNLEVMMHHDERKKRGKD